MSDIDANSSSLSKATLENPPDAQEVSPMATAQFLTLLSELDLNMEADDHTEEQPIYLVSTCPDQPQIRIAEVPEQPSSDIEIITPESSGAVDNKKKRKRVISKKKSTHRPMRKSSSLSSSSSQNNSPPQSKAKLTRSEESCSAAQPEPGNVCRFHCKRCGQLRFLLVRGCLPLRSCECGSTCVSVPSWTKADQSHLFLGLGRESYACPRCLRIYSSENQLRRHHCVELEPSACQAADQLKALCVVEVPTCPYCKDTFIFDSLLTKHVKKMHRRSVNKR